MKYTRFEELPVWKESINLATRIYLMTENEQFKGKYSLRDQIERAAVSISNNIAGGFERGTTNELINFIYIARGSAGEVRSMLHLFERMSSFSNLKSEISNLRSTAENISRQLRGWAGSLQDSEIKGQRYLNEKSRREERRKKERQEDLEEMRKFREELESREKARIDAQ